MRILAPFTRVPEVEPLIENGADELYCGLMPSAFKQQFSNMGSLNCYGSARANLQSIDELKQAVALASSHDVPVFLALNAQGFSKSQASAVLGQAEKAVKAGVDALIIADPGIISAVSKAGLSVDMHVSTIGAVFNSSTVEFYRGLGARRVVFPKELTIGDVQDIVGNSRGIETEAFVLNGLCHNVEGFCTFQHGMLESSGAGWPSPVYESLVRSFGHLPKKASSFLLSHTFLRNSSACVLPYGVKRLSGSSPHAFAAASSSPKIGYYLDSCAACSIPPLLAAGLDVIKIEGRFFSTEKKLSDLAFIRSCLDFASTGPSKADYLAFATGNYKKAHGFPCCKSDCYPIVEGP